MDVSRRQMIGLGAVAGATAALAALPNVAGASSPADSGFGDGAPTQAVEAAGIEALTPGLSYSTIDPTAFHTYNTNLVGRIVNGMTGASLATAASSGLMAPLDVPVGAVIKEVTFFYAITAGTVRLGVWKKSLTGPYAVLNNGPAGLPVPVGVGIQSVTIPLTETVDGTASYMVLIDGLSTVTQFVHGALIGFVPVAPRPAFIPINPIPRALDTRATGGKLQPLEERVVPLGVPANASAAVINLTVTDTELGGFVSVFPANVAWNGNSSINWATTGQILANGVITGVDPTGAIKIRGAVNRTHVVIDVQGYLL